VETAKDDGLLMQRYVDVDLVPVAADIPLTVKQNALSRWGLAGLALLVIPIGLVVLKVQRGRKPPAEVAKVIPMPSHFTPVTVLGFLRRLRDGNNLPADQFAALEQEIEALENQYFGPAAPLPDSAALEQLAARWQQRAA
jgi:hypothetical protein